MIYPTIILREDDPRALLADSGYCAEEMLNGRRLLVSKQGGVVRAFNRGRIPYVLPLSAVNLARSFSGDFVLDGELVGESFIAFDMLEGSGVIVSDAPLTLRRKLLERISPFPIALHAVGEQDKTALLLRVREACGPGVVFKRLDAAYEPERHLYGVRFHHYDKRSSQIGDLSIEECSIGAQRGGKFVRPELLLQA